MLPSTFTVTRNILAVKRDRETFLCTEEQAQQIEDAVFQKTIRIKLLDKAGKTIFWGDPKEIKEFRDDTRDLKKQISDQENSEQSEYEKRFLSKVSSVERVSPTKTARVTRCSSGRKDIHSDWICKKWIWRPCLYQLWWRTTLR